MEHVEDNSRRQEALRRYYENLRNDPDRWKAHIERLRENKKARLSVIKDAPDKLETYLHKRREALRKYRECRDSDPIKREAYLKKAREYAEKKRAKKKAARPAKPERLVARKKAVTVVKPAVTKPPKMKPPKPVKAIKEQTKRSPTPQPERYMHLLSWHSRRAKMLTVQEAADMLKLTVSELIRAGIEGKAPRPCGFNECNETVYAVHDIKQHMEKTR
jgi:hypothetical protein